MIELIDKYTRKLVSSGLTADGGALLGGLDADLVWNRPDPRTEVLEGVFAGLNINSLLFAEPSEPYRSIIGYLASRSGGAIRPKDSETRTFMHDLPVVDRFEPDAIVEALRQRKSVIVRDHGVVTWGTVSPEQAYVFFSSLCFACFVKFHSDYLRDRRSGSTTARQEEVFRIASAALDDLPEHPPPLMTGPFGAEDEVYRAVSQAGRETVKLRLVDSFFGNVSYLRGDTLYISQSGSSLDELEACIDPCVLDGSSCAGITASSELTAHREVVLRTGKHAVLHGHPKFSVILSLDCRKRNCPLDGQCHIRCRDHRSVEDIPIVPGEVGTGPHGLCHTLPPAMDDHRGVIVYGHGLFTVGRDDFNEAFANLLDIERMCRRIYFERLG